MTVHTHWVVVITLKKTILKMSSTNLHRKQIFKILIQLFIYNLFSLAIIFPQIYS